MRKEIATFRVNGQSRDIIVTPNMTLADVLRDTFGLTGTKESCRCAECGSCTVLVDGAPMLACSTLAVSVRSRDIVTIEGLSPSGEMHPLQKAFIEHGSIQCGFCTPGMVMMAKALLDENANPTAEEIKEGLGGNLCRCTGYSKIVTAVQAAARDLQGKAGAR
jgi:aerobic-type carbon monoxide dehydrogenase small subunit (CoxS/CutS family)